MEMAKTLELLQNDVQTYYSQLRRLHPEHEIFYKMFLSPFHEEADILIFGFNPGNGESEVLDVNPRENFEYLVYNFPLAKDTREVFKLADLAGLLESKVVKSNIFYLVTPKGNDLYGKIKKLKSDEATLFYNKSHTWTFDLIILSKPKLIILEGKTTFEEFKIAVANLCELFDIKYFEGNISANLRIEDLYIKIVAFERNGFSGIKNKSGLAELLREEVSIIFA